MAILGIDLGTTNSLGAVYRNGKVELIPNRFGSFLTPSVVSVMEDGSVAVGQIAKERLITHPKDTAASFKKKMGTTQNYVLGGRNFLPEELSGFVISAIVEDARNYLQEDVEDVIISVPAYFHDKQRVATKRAGALAGVMVKRIINEPSAAALASYFDTRQEQLFLVLTLAEVRWMFLSWIVLIQWWRFLQFPEIIISVEMILMKPLPVVS